MANNSAIWWCVATTIIVLGGIATLIAWSVDHAKDPHFFVDQTSVSISNNLNTSTFNLSISAYNPNRNYFIYYDVLMLSVYHDSNKTLIAYEVLPDPFVQHPRATLSLTAALLAQSDVGLKKGTAGLEVRVRAVTRFKYKGWKRFHHMMKATCSPVAVLFNSSSSSSLGNSDQRTRCYVNTY